MQVGVQAEAVLIGIDRMGTEFDVLAPLEQLPSQSVAFGKELVVQFQPVAIARPLVEGHYRRDEDRNMVIAKTTPRKAYVRHGLAVGRLDREAVLLQPSPNRPQFLRDPLLVLGRGKIALGVAGQGDDVRRVLVHRRVVVVGRRIIRVRSTRDEPFDGADFSDEFQGQVQLLGFRSQVWIGGRIVGVEKCDQCVSAME